MRDHYAELFEAAPSLTSTLGSLVFTGDSDDPETLFTLSQLGYAHPEQVTRDGPRLAFRPLPGDALGDRARTADRIRAGADRGAGDDRRTPTPPSLAFDRFLARLPAGVQLFSLLSSNPGLLGLLATMMATAPRLAETVVHRPMCSTR